jgi:LysR family transcriptional activator of nhaA
MSLDVESLNFHHLRYFWCVVVEGGVLPASRRLRVSHPTVSAQIKALEDQLGVGLFDRRGRSLELTDAGKAAFAYADRIFALGRDFLAAMQRGPPRARLRVGVTDDLPKLFVRQLLEPALNAEPRPRLVVEEERQQTLLGRLLARQLDLVVSDAPAPPAFRSSVRDHRLGRSGSSFLAAPALADRLAPDFPASLHGAPLLAPLADGQLGQIARAWFLREGLAPDVIAEIADSALLKTLSRDGLGVTVVPTVAEAPARSSYGLRLVGRRAELEVEYFAAVVGEVEPEGWPGRIIAHARALLVGAVA